MRTKTFVWLALCFITALSVGLMIVAIFHYDYEQFDKTNDFEDDSIKMIKKSENSFILFYSLEDPNFGFQNSWQSFRMKIQDWNNTNVVYVGKIECSVFRSTCKTFKVDRYPTIAWIKNGKVVEEYVGDDISESIKKFFDKLVMIVMEQKPTTVEEVTSSVKINPSPKILQGGSLDIIRRFIENENIQREDSTVSTKPTEASMTVNYENLNTTTETSKQGSSNSSTGQYFEPNKIEKSTNASNTSDEKFKEQILVTTTEKINMTNKVEESTKFFYTTNKYSHESVETKSPEISKIPDETYTSSLSIPDSTAKEYENQTDISTTAMPEHSSSENSTISKEQKTTIDESSSESIIMTRPTERQSSEQESSKENEESNKSESDEDESLEDEDDDPFGLGGLFGNSDNKNAEYEGESDENNDTENEEDGDAQKSVEKSEDQMDQGENEAENKSSTKWEQEKDENKKSEVKPKTIKYESKSTEYREDKRDIKTKVESTTNKNRHSEEKQKSREEPETPKYDSGNRKYRKKSEESSIQESQKDFKTDTTTKNYQYSKGKQTSKHYSKAKEYKSERKDYKKHTESSKHK